MWGGCGGLERTGGVVVVLIELKDVGRVWWSGFLTVSKLGGCGGL